ncbi:rSAM-associated Gly-rich repeat secreted protein [Synechococcus sp. BIOS-U3-1]|uniref:GrrA/OscA1 family cyclophane-containing rSAM-modified RiPP n=1 Tax=Synechococcus sp. BIOS-U3-1 TaxID=1400865 RepID=UPI000C46C779|nr:GrrA/OscA1 family cyclophane-containing rSAM-modified RiPP [Synechococcus sp. BIOS-U3-1]MAD68597.1 rSAM-associated Gly-rich repeat protein [Synechococcus sp. CPC100]QNI59736.1 rSAM-associated Gly-rich repeat secreted protein [Synechococcus sp. BIOS-U3-1]|tara:strand:- start:1183 stop:1494 length:312 start_codon:yes stop_codon:yes gene_type:complete
MNKTSLLSLAAVLATSAVLCESSRAAVHNEPDLGNSLEQRIERMSPEAWAMMKRNGLLTEEEIARAWGNGGGRAWGNGGARRGFANGGGGGFANGYRGGFANW